MFDHAADTEASTLPASPYYTPAEVPALFRRTLRTIRMWSAMGILVRIKVGKGTYYRRSEVDRLLMGGAVE